MKKRLSEQKMQFLDRFFLLWTLFKWDWSIVLVGLTYNCITRIPKNFTKVSKNAKICSSHEDRLWKGKKTLVLPQNISFSLTKYKIFCQTVLNVKSSEDFVSQIKVYVSFYLEFILVHHIFGFPTVKNVNKTIRNFCACLTQPLTRSALTLP